MEILKGTYLYIKRSIEAHLQEIIVILVENSEETLLKDRCRKRIRQDNNAVSRIG